MERNNRIEESRTVEQERVKARRIEKGRMARVVTEEGRQ